jgi:predicted membrane channel-forming protein YqfA (hemolysin III family)
MGTVMFKKIKEHFSKMHPLRFAFMAFCITCCVMAIFALTSDLDIMFALPLLSFMCVVVGAIMFLMCIPEIVKSLFTPSRK